MVETVALQQNDNIVHSVHLKDYQAPLFFIDEIDLEFDLNDQDTIVQSRLRVRRNRHVTASKNELVLNGEELELVDIALDGNKLTRDQYTLSSQHLVLHDLPDLFVLSIRVRINPDKNTALSGLYRSGKTYCTQCEAEGFRRITYFMDHPDVLSRYSTKITADRKQYPILLSNGNLIDSGSADNGRHWVKWEDPFKKPCYLFALVAGDFDLLEDRYITQSGREVALRIYVDKGYRDQAHHAMYSIKEAMRWDETAYGREYDLDVFMLVAINDFNMGAMENKGLNIFNTKYALAKPETATDDDYIHILSVVGHEYFHNWSGNRVTCRDWFQLSLKEGLTIFRDQSFTEDMLSPAVMRIRDVIRLRDAQFPEDNGPLAHPVRPETYIEINNFYTATVYEKGAEVLRMLQTILGKEVFRKGMDLYFARHDGQAVTIEDYIKVMEDISGVDLSQFRLWYSQAGTPVVTVESDYHRDNKTFILRCRQTTPATPGQPNKKPLLIPIRAGFLMEDRSPEREELLLLSEAEQTFTFYNVSAKPVPSLLRHFSAPVKLQYPYTHDELMHIFKYDSDAFSRWEAGQKIYLHDLLKLIAAHQSSQPLQVSDHVYEMVSLLLTNDIQDRLFIAELLMLPSERYLSEQMQVVDVDAIHAAREFMASHIAQHAEKAFAEQYQRCHEPPNIYIFSMEAVGKRQLKNICLAYLSRLPAYVECTMKQFAAGLKTNMTDTQAALQYLSHLDLPVRTQALSEFYSTWRDDALVVDKWFAIQAASTLPDTLNNVRQLLQHPAFDIKNPNKVYALIGTFCHRNPVRFHARDGAGYQFLRECVQTLDKLNPQVAARMVNPLTTWKRYDKERQQHMRAQLAVLLEDKSISSDLYELVTKSLQ